MAGSGTSTGAVGSGTSFGSGSGRSVVSSVSVMCDPYREFVSRNDRKRAATTGWRSGHHAPGAGRDMSPDAEQSPARGTAHVHPDVTDAVY
jgi:hypothetical protein